MSEADKAACTAIRFDAVGFAFGNSRFRFDFALPSAGITAVTGPSGSGKSTLLNLIAGFEQALSGRILLMGKDVTHLHPSERPVSIVFQENNLFAHLDLFTNIGLGIDARLRLSAGNRREVAAAMAKVGLAGFERRKPATLSGGERQRAAFARALVRRRPILLLDEPFAALDKPLRREMGQLLVALHRDVQNTVVIVSHDPQEVEEIADRVLPVAGGIALQTEATKGYLGR